MELGVRPHVGCNESGWCALVIALLFLLLAIAPGVVSMFLLGGWWSDHQPSRRPPPQPISAWGVLALFVEPPRLGCGRMGILAVARALSQVPAMDGFFFGNEASVFL